MVVSVETAVAAVIPVAAAVVPAETEVMRQFLLPVVLRVAAAAAVMVETAPVLLLHPAAALEPVVAVAVDTGLITTALGATETVITGAPLWAMPQSANPGYASFRTLSKEIRFMSKVFQIVDGLCYWDATSVHPTLQSIKPGQYHPSIAFAEAPDHVFEGWGFDETQQGDARFIAPTPPAGWLYDRETGTFYPDPNYTPPTQTETETQDMQSALSLLGVEPEEA